MTKSDANLPAARRSMHSSLALGSRVAEKIPQDVACTAVDPDTLARVVVVADGVSECRATPEQVREFAYRAARTSAVAVLQAFVKIEHAFSGRPVESNTRDWVSECLRDALFGALSSLSSVAEQGDGAACVVGGALWAPRFHWATVFAVGNIGSVLVTSSEAEPTAHKVFGLAGSSQTLLVRRPGALAPGQIEIESCWLDAEELAIAVASDGVSDPGTGSRFFGPLAEIERDPNHAWLSHIAQVAAQRRHSLGESIMPDEPWDDATLTVCTWSRADTLSSTLRDSQFPPADRVGQ